MAGKTGSIITPIGSVDDHGQMILRAIGVDEVRIIGEIAFVVVDVLLPAKLVKFFFGTNELHCPVV